MTVRKELRLNLIALMASFQEATGLANATASRIVAADSKFFWSLLKNEDRDFRAGTYDFITSRFSALWPEGAEWPEDIDRPDPASEIEKEKIELARQIEAARNRAEAKSNSIHPDWPAGLKWPDDIPLPVADAHKNPAAMEQ